MRNASDRQILLLTVLVSLASVIYILVVSGGDIALALVGLPMFVTVSYFALRFSRAMGRRLGPKPKPAPEPPPPLEQTSTRPEHARKRRERRRRRGRPRDPSHS